MKSTRRSVLPEKFEGAGLAIDFDRSLCLPPDMAGVAMGYEAATVINTIRRTAREPKRPVRALELGTGSGVCLAALLRCVEHKEGVIVTGLDIDESAVAITNHNVEQYLHDDDESAQSDIFVGDWYEDALWDRLGVHTYDVIMCNPPYLARGIALMDGYETVPRSAVYANDEGLAHHRFLLPRLLGLLSIVNGATVITRFHSTIHGETDLSRSIDTLVSESVQQAPPLSDLAILRRYSALVAAGRNMATVTISRSKGALPPHLTAEVLYSHE